MSLPAQVALLLDRLVLGASDMGVVMGVNPYKAPVELWRERVGDLPPFKGNDQTRWGHLVEPAVRQWYVDRCGQAVYVPPESMLHPQHNWLRATPDGIVLGADDGAWLHGFEAKKASGRLSSQWGEPGSDEVPPSYLIQVQCGMAVTGLSRWDIAVTIGGEPPVCYTVRRDDELIAIILEAGAQFLDCVEAGTPPPLDNSEAYADYLAARYPWSSEEFLEATPEIEAVAESLRDTQALCKQAESDTQGLKNQIAAFVGEASGVQTSIGRINYKPRKGRTDYAAVLDRLAAAYSIPRSEIEELKNSNRTADSRPVVAYWREPK